MRNHILARAGRTLFAATMAASCSFVVNADGTLEDYKRANRLFSGPDIYAAYVSPHWIGNGKQFWYARESSKGQQYLLVDPLANKVTPMFNHKKLAKALGTTSGEKTNASVLPIDDLQLMAGTTVARITMDGAVFDCNLTAYKCLEAEVAPTMKGEVLSPDGRWAAYVQDYNLFVRSTETGEKRALTTDGVQYHAYATTTESQLNSISVTFNKPTWGDAYYVARVIWSPDSSKILTYRVDDRNVPLLPFIENMPGGKKGARPKLHTARVAFPADKHTATSDLIVFDVESGKRTDIDYPPIYTYYDLKLFGNLGWSADSEWVHFTHDERGYRRVYRNVANASTGKVTKLLKETRDTYFENPYQTPSSLTTKDGKAFFWFSPRSGWKHLYRYDMRSKKLLNAVTSGGWRVDRVHHIDEENQWIYFMGNGLEKGRDVYYTHLYRARFDGSELELLTPENANHSVIFSPDGSYFVDRYSTVDTAPVTVLRSASGAKLRTLETADISNLIKVGWQKPERFTVKARDGKTDLYGVLYRPSTFDPAKKYPILDNIYGGPQAIVAPRTFQSGKAIAELGFVVIEFDGMGTPGRSKAFQDVSYNTGFKEAGGLEDHILAIQQLAERYPYMDIDRVGIYGHSGGGYASARAMMDYPDFFKVAVSSAGSHDQRLYQLEWGEKYIGPYSDKNSDYEEQANSFDVSRFKGKMLLVHGDMDDDVHPVNTMQLVDALISANKDFDMLILPGLNHSDSYMDPYFIRRRWDYFVQHLMGVTPPPNYKIDR